MYYSYWLNQCRQLSYYFLKLATLTYSISITDKYMFGTPIANVQTERSERCSFIIDSNVQKSGEIMSVTYPGTYPKDLHCSYQFTGNPNQRLRIEFRDFDLFYGGAQ